MPNLPRRSTISPPCPEPVEGLHTGHATPVFVRASSSGSLRTYLHFGKLEHAINLPKRPSRSISFPSLHSGHASQMSLGGAISEPSSLRAPRQVGNLAQLMKRPFLESL